MRCKTPDWKTGCITGSSTWTLRKPLDETIRKLSRFISRRADFVPLRQNFGMERAWIMWESLKKQRLHCFFDRELKCADTKLEAAGNSFLVGLAIDSYMNTEEPGKKSYEDTDAHNQNVIFVSNTNLSNFLLFLKQNVWNTRLWWAGVELG